MASENTAPETCPTFVWKMGWMRDLAGKWTKTPARYHATTGDTGASDCRGYHLEWTYPMWRVRVMTGTDVWPAVGSAARIDDAQRIAREHYANWKRRTP